MIYITLGHRIANTTVGGGGSSGPPLSGIDQLGLSMLIAAVAATPFGIAAAVPAFAHPAWLLWGIGVGGSSSVIRYVTDQLAIARRPETAARQPGASTGELPAGDGAGARWPRGTGAACAAPVAGSRRSPPPSG